MPIKNSKQKWQIGAQVQVGFQKLIITGFRSVVDGLPDIYTLTNLRGDRTYEFTPHNGIVRID